MRKDIFNLGLILIVLSIVSLFVSTLTMKVGFSGPSIHSIISLAVLSIGIILSIVSLFLKPKK